MERLAVAGTGAHEVSYDIRGSDCSLFVVGVKTLWEAAVLAELKRYKDMSKPIPEGVYRPREMCKAQLRFAAVEALRRSKEEEDDRDDCNSLNYVLVAQCIGFRHRDAIAPVVASIDNFVAQLGDFDNPIFTSSSDGTRVLMSGDKVAADGVLQRSFPAQGRPQQLRTSIVVELEYQNRGPKQLLEQLSDYLLQLVADYVLGIKVYKRTGPAVAAGRRPFAAIALLWRRGGQPVRSQAQFVESRSFGTCALSQPSLAALTQQCGLLQRVQRNQIVHPAAHSNLLIS